MKRLKDYKKVSLDDIEKLYKLNTYKDLYDTVVTLINEEKIRIIKASGTNGKSPALYNRYTVIREEADNSKYIEEINYKITPKLDVYYFRNNIDKYIENREYILKLNDFIINHEDKLKNRVSEKERSFQIWQEEKYLGKKGKALLKKLNFDIEELNYYETNEPLAYYSITQSVPQNVLIIENMDTFYTFRKQLLSGNNSIFNVDIGTVIYGRGKGIYKCINDFDFMLDSSIANKDNTILYLGDLDYEGIIIYEGLEELIKDDYSIKPFVEGYEAMIDKGEKYIYNMPETKEKQNRNMNGAFLEYFNLEYRKKILDLLEKDLYIPQEILNIGDLEDGI